MEFFEFNPWIDIPVAIFVTLCFVINFRVWCQTAPEDLRPLLKPNLTNATWRLVMFFSTILLLCWLTSISVWTVFLAVWIVFLFVAISVGNSLGIDFAIVVTGGLIRELCFGFPQLILRPPVEKFETTVSEKEPLVGCSGITTTALRPSGRIEIGGKEYLAASEGGVLIEKGVSVVVVRQTKATVFVKDTD